jgi:hypothetical protein
MASRGPNDGRSSHKLYIHWLCMHKRCNDPGRHNYKHYGGKGITVCDRWTNFWNFAADMEGPYFEGATLDRIDNEKDYSPDNCRWSTRLENNRKRKGIKLTVELADNIRVLYATKRWTQQAIADRFGITQKQVSYVVTGRSWGECNGRQWP